jgi:hypothetical protein
MGIVRVVKNLLNHESVEDTHFADWTKRLFDAQGNEVELSEFVKLHYAYNDGRWVNKQFEVSGLYWLLYSSTDQRDRGLWLLRVTVGRKSGGITYIIRSFATAEETLSRYEAHTNVNDRPLRVPSSVREATLALITDRV